MARPIETRTRRTNKKIKKKKSIFNFKKFFYFLNCSSKIFFYATDPRVGIHKAATASKVITI
jgi:hypothetical protein